MSGPPGGIPSLVTPPGNPEFVDLRPDYKCRIIQGAQDAPHVVRDAMQTSCGHRVCENCLSTMFSGGQETVNCPVNEEDCEPQTRDSIAPDPGARREVRKLKVYCTHKALGCHWQKAWKDLEQHEPQCEYRPTVCQFRDLGCATVIPLKDKAIHETKHCEFRPEPCQHCNQMVPKAKHEEHLRNVCENYPMPCPWNCGSQPMLRRELQQHFEICPNKQVECKYRQAGCEFVGTLKDVTEHELNDLQGHLDLTLVYTAKQELNTVECRRRLQELSSEREHAQQQQGAVPAELTNIKIQIERVGSSSKELKVKMVSMTERIIHLERKVEDVAKKADVDRHERDVRALQTSLTQVRSQLAQVERQAGAAGGGGRPGTGAGSGQENAELTRRLDVHDTQFAQLDVQMAELDLRFQIVESTNFNGTLLWKLRDYTRRKQEAVSGKTLSLYSQPFYTHRYGYKMCARVYLNGDGMGKGTHMSLFFVMMKGEYDSLLSWPFQQKVTMILLDQDSGQTNLSDTFRPDPASSSFRKPTSDMNIASGCPLFVAHNVLETPRYLKDDVLFLKFIVDLSSLNHP